MHITSAFDLTVHVRVERLPLWATATAKQCFLWYASIKNVFHGTSSFGVVLFQEAPSITEISKHYSNLTKFAALQHRCSTITLPLRYTRLDQVIVPADQASHATASSHCACRPGKSRDWIMLLSNHFRATKCIRLQRARGLSLPVSFYRIAIRKRPRRRHKSNKHGIHAHILI